jgi:hypothetical protein
MRRVIRGNKEDLVELEDFACVPCDGQVTAVHGVETAAEESQFHAMSPTR